MKRNEKKQYVVTLLSTLFALGIIVVFTFTSFYNVAKEDAITIGETAVKERAEKLNIFLEESFYIIDFTEQMLQFMDYENMDEVKRHIVQISKKLKGEIHENFMGIYGWINNTYIDGEEWIPDENYVATERIWYTEAIKANGKIVIVEPYLDALKNQIIISLSKVLADGKSVISIDKTLAEVQTLAEEINLNGTGYGFVINEEGLILAHSNPKERGKNYLTAQGFQETDMNAVIKKVMENPSQKLPMQIDGVECFVFSQKVEHGWYIVMIIDSSDLFARVERVLVISIFLSIIIFALVTYFCTASYLNKKKIVQYADELKENQRILEENRRTLEERVTIQTREIREQANEMIRMQENVIEGMATLIECRDENTGEHVRNTKKYVGMIVKRLNIKRMHSNVITDDYISQIINAAPLHDIGKIRISDLILNKPGKLDENEFEIMKTHSTHGGEIVQSILGGNADKRLVEIACDIAKYHHERWDGKGYPKGLKEKEIPLAARIMAVADVFDALISKRVYKDAMPIKKAFEIIQEESGRQFDPEVVTAFLEQKQEIIQFIDRE